MDEQITQLRAVLRTLDAIEISGRQNLDRLLGCMITLEKVIKAMDEKKGETAE